MSYNVLVVDDDPDVRRLVEMKLKIEGIQPHMAVDGHDALDKLDEAPFDLVILDIMMPRMDGVETCRELRQRPGYDTVPVLMLTARAQIADIERGFDAGATDYMVKPFSPRELSDRVLGLLDTRGAA
jgi:two-component system phosphate regulon response regulator PhoB